MLQMTRLWQESGVGNLEIIDLPFYVGANNHSPLLKLFRVQTEIDNARVKVRSRQRQNMVAHLLH